MHELKQDRLTSSRAVHPPPGRPASPIPRLWPSSLLLPPVTCCSCSGSGCDSTTPQSTTGQSCVCSLHGSFRNRGDRGTWSSAQHTAHNRLRLSPAASCCLTVSPSLNTSWYELSSLLGSPVNMLELILPREIQQQWCPGLMAFGHNTTGKASLPPPSWTLHSGICGGGAVWGRGRDSSETLWTGLPSIWTLLWGQSPQPWVQ